jgi:hypothetical protein
VSASPALRAHINLRKAVILRRRASSTSQPFVRRTLINRRPPLTRLGLSASARLFRIKGETGGGRRPSVSSQAPGRDAATRRAFTPPALPRAGRSAGACPQAASLQAPRRRAQPKRRRRNFITRLGAPKPWCAPRSRHGALALWATVA